MKKLNSGKDDMVARGCLVIGAVVVGLAVFTVGLLLVIAAWAVFIGWVINLFNLCGCA